VNTYGEAAVDSHIHSRDMLQTIDVDGQPVPLTAPAVNFSRTPVRIRSRAPAVGQHNREICRELGLDEEAVARLIAEGAIGPSPEG
jgi:crotonobetainyl-CoA:carnitine CoA-transferase CaiB-like acyl-CoA transferase